LTILQVFFDFQNDLIREFPLKVISKDHLIEGIIEQYLSLEITKVVLVDPEFRTLIF